ncbi:MAG: TIGR03790 family protein [Verrucomicrobia bacterium]|nr:TIGR03790 family protein [Verrucomicrobiota bacterium]
MKYYRRSLGFAYRRQRNLLRAILCLWIADGSAGRAGGGPQNVLIVVNEREVNSLELGHYYREKRGIPERNVCRINLAAPSHNTFPHIFEKSIHAPIVQHIEKEHLGDQIDFIVLCMTTPTRINDIESIPSALFYGYKKAHGAPPCDLPAETRSFYYGAEHAFSHDLAGREGPAYLVMMLAAPTPEEARRLVDRAVAADGTAPSGTFYLLKPPSDTARNVRYKLFDEMDFQARFMNPFPRREFAEQNVLTGLTDVMGYMTGLSSHPDWFWSTNIYLPGAMADHFTSFGARLPKPSLGQGSLLQWIGAGATASYGTVGEPCNFTEKFPHPLAFFWYARGFNLAESYWMSVAHPYQGLFVGEPLAAPYARPPRVSVTAPAAGQTVSGTVTVQVAAVGSPERPCASLDFYLDDLWVASVTNIRPQPWN